MQALRYHSFGSPGDLRLEDVPPPEPDVGEVLVGVRYASVNPVDWKIAAGKFRFLVKHGLPRTMGSDFAGVVTHVGSGVDGVRPGDRVWGFVDPFACARGTFADFCAVPVKSRISAAGRDRFSRCGGAGLRRRHRRHPLRPRAGVFRQSGPRERRLRRRGPCRRAGREGTRRAGHGDRERPATRVRRVAGCR